MTAPRRTRTPLDFDQEQVMAKLREARAILVEARRTMRPKSGLARATDAVIGEIDEFALVMTGDRTFFHARSHASLSKGQGQKRENKN
ncbi:putative myosin [Roseibium sp. TrichSKD4]|uniref:hypothetical protein n=1 Tax=Roseibium sp. TrichSKD4 TaxID=744980 RepID=UPI0001E5629E|nr:hypothetical protein [Roseibium sp. TrichSKD4]EFO33818.1 putative myosin [Roseibium sp. TrichSKD4]